MKERFTAFFGARLAAVRAFGMRQYLLRLLLGFFAAILIYALGNPARFTETAFYSDAQLFGVILHTAVFFLVALLIAKDRAVALSLVAVATVYFADRAFGTNDYAFAFAASLVVVALAVYADLSFGKWDIGPRTLYIGAGVLFTLFVLFVGGLCCLYYRNYYTQTYDFGIFSQMFHYMRETGKCLTTCERDGLLSHFAVHFSPIYYLLLPFYFLIPSPETLLVMQAIIAASGVIPVLLLCRRFAFSRRATLAFAAIYLLYPAFLEPNFYYLHENCFLSPIILWLCYFFLGERVWPILAASVLLITVKEDATVYLAVVALYFLLTGKGKRRWTALGVLLLAVSSFVLITQLMGSFGEGVMSDSRYGDYIYDGGGLLTVIKACLQNPAYAVRQILRQEKLIFILQMLAPLAFLPLASRNPARLVLLIPFLLVNLMTSYVYQYNIGFQYVYGSGALLFFLAIVNAKDLDRHRARVILCALLCSVLVFSGGAAHRLGFINQHKTTEWIRTEMDTALSMIPEDASVAASTFLVANLSARDEIYELETTKHAKECEYIVIDLRFESSIKPSRYENSSYERIYYADGVVAIYKNLTLQ